MTPALSNEVALEAMRRNLADIAGQLDDVTTVLRVAASPEGRRLHIELAAARTAGLTQDLLSLAGAS